MGTRFAILYTRTTDHPKGATMKKLITIIILLALGITLFTLAGKKVENEISGRTAKATAAASMMDQ
jgi:hypothetical protein